MNRLKITLLATMALVCSACASKPVVKPPMTQSGAQIQYTPAGCTYTVTTPAGAANAVYSPATPAPATIAPLHVHANFASDPSTSFAVNWKGDPASTLTQILYGTSQSQVTEAMGAAGGVTVQIGHSFDVPSAANPGTVDVHVQEAHVCGLTPATTYYYKVGNPGAFSNVFAVTTAPPVGFTGEFRFAVAGDSRNNPATFAQAEAAIQARGPLFQVFTGDAVDVAILQPEWDAFFEATQGSVLASDVLATIPAFMTDGNHEAMELNYLAQFALPEVAGGGETESGQTVYKEWYSFNYGNIHFVDLNDSTFSADAISGEEATWLDADLTAVDRTKTPWIIAVHHQPLYSCDSVHGSDVALQTAWQPIYDAHQVDLVLNGHVHNYQRSNPIRGTNVNAAAGQGTVYVLAGAAGAPLYGYNTGTCPFSNNGLSTSNYGIVDVNGNTLTVTAYNLNAGDVQLDQFTLTK